MLLFLGIIIGIGLCACASDFFTLAAALRIHKHRQIVVSVGSMLGIGLVILSLWPSSIRDALTNSHLSFPVMLGGMSLSLLPRLVRWFRSE